MNSDDTGDAMTFSTPVIQRNGHVLHTGLLSCLLAIAAGSIGVAYAAGADELPVAAGDFVQSGSVAAPAVSGANMTVKQHSQRAILNWKSFNIGKDAAVRFVQPSKQAVAVNKIYQADPSRVMGSLQANGQLYLINPNGIIFGEHAKVNVGALVASTMGIKDRIVNEVGLLNAIKDGEAAFQAYQAYEDADEAQREFLKTYKELVDADLPDGMGVIRIEPNARLTADPNGFVMVIAPAIENQGTIETPSGQTILAAGNDKVYLAEPTDFGDAGLVGMLVEVDSRSVSSGEAAAFEMLAEKADPTGSRKALEIGEATNAASGSIRADRGNVTLMGMAVNQDGQAHATTAVDVGGSIRLVARDTQVRVSSSGDIRYQAEAYGSVKIGEGSVTEAMPELGDATMEVDANTQMPSRIEVVGQQVRIERDARLTARSGEIDVLAISSTPGGLPGPGVYDAARFKNDGALPGSSRVTGDGLSELVVEEGVQFDVSGFSPADWADWLVRHPEDAAMANPLRVSVERNVLDLKVLGYELRDSPLQTDLESNPERLLNGATLYFDLRDLPEIADVSAAVAGFGRTLAERSTTGGTVALKSTGSLAVDDGVTIDVSGGYLEYVGGYVNTTQLVSSSGLIFDVAEAPRDLVYERLINPRDRGNRAENFEAGYIEGKDAGTVELFAFDTPDSVFGGEVLGGVTQGRHQRLRPGESSGVARAYDEMPAGGSLTLARTGDLFLAGGSGRGSLSFFSDPSLSGTRLTTDGFSAIDVISTRSVTLATGQRLSLEVGGDYRFSAASVDLLGAIDAPASTLAFSATGSGLTTGAAIAIGNAAVLDVSGAWINDLGNGAVVRDSLFTDAGEISLSVQSLAPLNMHGSLRANAGGWVNAAGDFIPGDGGDIALSVDFDAAPGTPRLLVDGVLQAYTFGADAGSSLTLKAPGFLLGGLGSGFGTLDSDNRLLVGDDAFSSGGFSSYDLVATHQGMEVRDNAQIEVSPQIMLLSHPERVRHGAKPLSSAALRRPLAGFEPPSEISIQQAVSEFAAVTSPIRIGANALLKVNDHPSSRIAMQSDVGMLIGTGSTLRARSGELSLRTVRQEIDRHREGQAIWIADGATLDVSAASATYRLGSLVAGDVHDAGSIDIRAERGYVIAEPGSRFDIRGRSVRVDLPGGEAVDRRIRPEPFEHAAGGELSLRTQQGLFFFGDVMAGVPAGNPLSGGKVSVRYSPDRLESITFVGEALFPLIPPQLVLGRLDDTAGGAAAYNWEQLAFSAPFDPVPEAYQGQAWIDPEALAASGADALEFIVRPYEGNAPVRDFSGTVVIPQDLGASLAFHGDMAIEVADSLLFDARVIASDGGRVSLDSPYLSLGSRNRDFFVSSDSPAYDPLPGIGSLRADATLIDLTGVLAFQGFGGSGVGGDAAIQLHAAEDIRLRGLRRPRQFSPVGSVSAGSSMLLDAGRATYVTSLTEFGIALTHGTLTFGGGSDLPARGVFSAGASLAVNAPEIYQDGTLLVPFGSLRLEADGDLVLAPDSLTSVSGDGMTMPFGTIGEEGVWLSAFGSAGGNGDPLLLRELEAPPQKRIDLVAESIDIQHDARLNVNGGGELLAVSFVPGPGGSTDVLASNNAQGAFAIVPGIPQTYGTWDSSLSQDFPYPQGTVIEIAAGSAGPLAPGVYTVLPPQYAVASGAALVTPDDNLVLRPGQSSTGEDGITDIAGRLGNAGTGSFASTWSGFTVETYRQVSKRAEYSVDRMDPAFVAAAVNTATPVPELLADAGRLLLGATTSLGLDGGLVPFNGAGRAPSVDISGDRVAILDSYEDRPGYVVLTADGLEGLGAESVLIGGTREINGDLTTIDAKSGEILVEDNDGGGLSLRLSELMLVAREGSHKAHEIVIGDGVVIETVAGALTDKAGQQLAAGDAATTTDAAFAAFSERALLGFDGFATGGGASAGLLVDSGAVLRANGGMALLAGGELERAGTVSVAEGATLFLAAETLSFNALADVNGSALSLRADVVEADASATLNFESLAIDAAGLVGNSAGGELVVNVADHLRFENSRGRLSTASPAPLDSLTFNVERSAVSGEPAVPGHVSLGTGNFSLEGFANAVIRAGTVAADNTHAAEDASAALLADGNLQVIADDIGVAAGAGLRIDATQGLQLDRYGADARLDSASTGLQGSIALEGASVHLNTALNAPSGEVALRARDGDVVLGDASDPSAASSATIDVSGQSVVFDRIGQGTSGGLIALRADHGDLRIANGSSLRMDAHGEDGHAGSLTLVAAEGMVELATGTELSAVAAGIGNAQGDLTVHGHTLAGGLAALNGLVQGKGFAESRYVRVGTGDLVLAAGESIEASRISLVADTGSIDILGTLDTRIGSRNGEVALRAGEVVRLSDDARVFAQAAIDPQLSGSSLELELGNPDGTVDVAGLLDLGAAGRLRIIVPRGDPAAPLGSIASLDGDLRGIDRVELVGMREYDAGADGRVGKLLGAIDGDNDAFFADVGELADLGFGLDPTLLHLMPGVTLSSTGDLVVDTDVDTFGWRSGDDGAVGLLRLSSAGDLEMLNNRSVSAGFDRSGPGLDRLTQGRSWDVQLVAGSDPFSVDPFALRPVDDPAAIGVGRIDLRNGSLVRTGTGDLDLVAAGNVLLEGNIYTAGRDAGGGSFTLAEGGTLDSSSYDSSYLAFRAASMVFPTDGGDLNLVSGGDLLASSTPGQYVNDWRLRTATPEGTVAETLLDFGFFVIVLRNDTPPTAVGIALQHFDSQVGSLGGGQQRVRVAGDVRNVAFNNAASARPVGLATLPETNKMKTETDVFEMVGGGNTDVFIAGDYLAGGLYQELGSASLRVMGSIGEINPDLSDSGAIRLALGDASLRLDAGGDLVVDSVYNPTLVAQSPSQSRASYKTRFVSLGDNSKLDLRATAGHVQLNNAAIEVGSELKDLSGETEDVSLALYPSKLHVTSFGGDVRLRNQTYLMPTRSDASLRVLAGRDLQGGTSPTGNWGQLIQPDLDPGVLPSAERIGGESLRQVDEAFRFNNGNLAHAATPVYQDDAEPNLLHAGGDIRYLTAALSKHSRITAGDDIDSFWFEVQHSLAGGDNLTLLQAGSDIIFPITRNRGTGRFVPSDSPTRGLRVAGPGEVTVLAGDDINLGASQGVLTTGNITNTALPETGASINLVAGLDQAPAYAQFIEIYLGDGHGDLSGYRAQARDHVAAKLGVPATGLTESEAVDWLRTATDQREHLDLYLSILDQELVAGGQRAVLEESTVFFDRAKMAVKALFPTAPTAPMQSQQGVAAALALNAQDAAAPEAAIKLLDAFSSESFRALNPADIEMVNVAGGGRLDPTTLIEVDGISGRITPASIEAALAVSDYRGDVVSLASRFSTEDGGDVRLVAPGGGLVAGTVEQLRLLSGDAFTKTGVVVPKDGDVFVMAGQDVIVNSSKIINRSSGGDMTVWSSFGNIDAGRGLRGAVVAAEPFALDNLTGVIIPNDSPDIVGSGIQNAPAGDGVPGDTFLLTELGVINAGTAGIQAESVTLFAAVVQNTEGLDLGNVTANVSLGTSDSAPAAGDIGVTASTNELVGDPTESLAATDAGQNDDELALLSVEVIGFGGDVNDLPATGAGRINCDDERNVDLAECRG
jgi:filamentous hemagglutinin family protein